MRLTATATVLLLAACATTPASDADAVHADVRDAAGTLLGRVSLVPEGAGTRIRGELQGLPAGAHALHIHAVGRCEPPFTTAGPHFNPQQVPHGRQHPQGGHAGDLPNVTAGADGRVQIDALARAPLAGDGGILDADGAAVVLHAAADDEVTDPAGNAGDRIACGVITR